MINYERARSRPRAFAYLTGLSLAAFLDLLPAFQEAYDELLDEEDAQRKSPRQRNRGAGRKGALPTIEEKLFFILFYFRQYPTQETLAFLFGFSQAQACIWIHRLSPLLNQALGSKQQLPARQPMELGEVMKECGEMEFMIDGTERPIRRPKDPERRKSDYSGKKKRHCKKNIVVTKRSDGKVIGLGATCPGSQHDKSCTDQDGFEFPEGSVLWKDTGFQGYEPSGTTTHQPKKKPRGKELTAEEKESNRLISQIRVKVEHSIGGIKVFRIVQDVFRNWKKGFDDLVMETACGLFNFRQSAKATT